MASTLKAQLAHIASNSSNSLDLKAQSKAHSQSLIFEPLVAAVQDFDTIYQICLEGFQELCQIDGRFQAFTRSIFSEQSKRVDRPRMTAAQNEELDVVLESFIRLVGSRVLLTPGFKALEWLIRRFRIHEHNTLCLVYTFLPYHTTPQFATLLSIMPHKLPKPLDFLSRYVKSLSSPPRQEIVYTAARNSNFFISWSNHVLRACRDGHQYHPMTIYWASVITESLVAQIDRSSAGSEKQRIHNAERILLQILPILNEGLTMQKAPDMRVGCYMILTGLASKMRLEDEVLTAMMEAVVGHRTQETARAELICLVVLAQKKEKANLSRKIVKELMSMPTIAEELVILNKHYEVGGLCLGLLIECARAQNRAREESLITLITTVLEEKLMTDDQLAKAIVEFSRITDPNRHLLDATLCLLEPERMNNIIRLAAENLEGDSEELQSRFISITHRTEDNATISIEPVMEDNSTTEKEDQLYDLLCDRLLYTEINDGSISPFKEPRIFGDLLQAFQLSSRHAQRLKRFSGLELLRRPSSSTQPLFISFLVCIWCGHHSAGLRSSAIRCSESYVNDEGASMDLQTLLPYIVFALADPCASVRASTVSLVMALWKTCSQDTHETKEKITIGQDDIYNRAKEVKDIAWLSPADLSAFFEKILLPNLEECSLDALSISTVFNHCLGGSHHRQSQKGMHHDLKASSKTAFIGFLCSHIMQSPFLNVKIRLLGILSSLEKVGGISKGKFLAPLILEYMKLDEGELHQLCMRENLKATDFANAVVGIIAPTEKDGLKILQKMIFDKHSSPSSCLRKAALARLTTIWIDMKQDIKDSFAMRLFEDSTGETSIDDLADLSQDSFDTLSQIPLSTNVLLNLLQHLISSNSDLGIDSTPSKRRKIGHGLAEGQATQVNDQTNQEFLKKTSVFLELVETSKAGMSTPLIAGLFHLLADLRQSKNFSVDTSFSQARLISCMVDSLKKAKDSGISLNRSSIRSDVVVDCFRTSTNTQVQNASLLLISTLATLVPDIIIDSVMPIFTFMGSTLLRQSDDYTAHIIDQAIESVVPPLIDSLRKDKNGPLAGASKLILSFVAAYDHIPFHRRLNLFATLVDKLGPDEFLPVLLTMLVQRHGVGVPIIKFAMDLSSRYEYMVQLKAVEYCLELIGDVLNPEGSITNQILMSDNSRSKVDTVEILVTLPMKLLEGRGLSAKITKALSKNDSAADEIRKIHSNMAKSTLGLIESSNLPEALSQKIISLFDALLNLLSLPESIKSFEDVLIDGPLNVQRRVLKSLELRIAYLKSGNEDYHGACLGFLPRLGSVLVTSSDSVLQQISIACIDRIVDRFGKLKVEEVAKFAETVAGIYALATSAAQTRLAALLCLTTFVEALGEAVVPIIPLAASTSLKNLQQNLETDQADEGLYVSTFSFFSSLLLYIPWLVTGNYLEQLLRMVYERNGLLLNESCQETRISTLELAAKQVSAHEFFSALKATWCDALHGGPRAIEYYLATLRIAIKRHPKSTIISQSQNLTPLFLELLDFRRLVQAAEIDQEYSKEQINEAEETISDIMIEMIYKLNDAHFKPIFSRILEWANHSLKVKAGKEQGARLTSFYMFLRTFFRTLKSIVTSYAGFIVEDAADVLNKAVDSGSESSTLWFRVIDTLHAAFEHDQDEFWQSPSHFAAISSPLLAQLGTALNDEAISTLIPCISALASAADSADNMKAINTAVLAHMRSESAAVRLVAVKCEIKLTEALGEEWLSLLPEMLPFISEAIEDDDEDVEAETRRWIRNIEGILGESLNSMLH